MPSWWANFSPKEKRKKSLVNDENKETVIDCIQRKLKNAFEKPFPCNRSKRHSGTGPSYSPLPANHISRSKSFFVPGSNAKQSPIPGLKLGRSNSEICTSATQGHSRSSELPMLFPCPGMCMGCSDTDDEPSDSPLLSTLTPECENGNKTAPNSPSRRTDSFTFINPYFPTSPKRGTSENHMQNVEIPNNGTFSNNPDSSKSSPSRVSHEQAVGCDIETGKTAMNSLSSQEHSVELSKPDSFTFPASQNLPTSPKGEPLENHKQNKQLLDNGALSNKLDSLISSPSRNSHEQAVGGNPSVEVTLLGSGNCFPTGSGHNSKHNVVGEDVSGQFSCPQNKSGPKSSPLPSPRMTNPGPSSRMHSLLHSRARGAVADGKQQSYKLPLPPVKTTKLPSSSSAHLTTSPQVPQSHARAENPITPGSRWKKGRILGRGTFGQVYLGFDSETGDMCAMKEVTLPCDIDDSRSKENVKHLQQEILHLSSLRHPNIVRYYDSEVVDEQLCIFMEYVAGGSIYKLLQEYGALGESAIRSYTRQILFGLVYLHTMKTVHRDVKGANILVDPSGRVKLADFGLAKYITGPSCPLSLKGSPYWMAPEVIMNVKGYNLAVDIWSLGCTIIEMATTKPPWSQYERAAAMFKVTSIELPAIPEILSEVGRDFVRLCLQKNPARRPTALQLLDHAFVRNAGPEENPILINKPSESLHSLAGTRSTMGIGDRRNMSNFVSEQVVDHQSKGFMAGTGTSEAQTQRNNLSHPLSPIQEPLPNLPIPPHPLFNWVPPSPPQAKSGQQMSYSNEGLNSTTRPQSMQYEHCRTPNQEPRPDYHRQVPDLRGVLSQGFFNVPPPMG
ncbi:hypothetical protein ACFE04_015418 [Oxalis oulophora]